MVWRANSWGVTKPIHSECWQIFCTGLIFFTGKSAYMAIITLHFALLFFRKRLHACYFSVAMAASFRSLATSAQQIVVNVALAPRVDV